MKFFFLFFSILIIFNGLSAQSITQLDQKNGFKEFKIGDSYSKWRDQLDYIGSKNNGKNKAYLYKGECCKMVFEYPLEEIMLVFIDNKLNSIRLTLEQIQKKYELSGSYTEIDLSTFKSLNSSFIKLFGKPTDFFTSENDEKFFCTWNGKKVLLLTMWEYLGYKSGDRNVISISKNELSKKIKNGF